MKELEKLKYPIGKFVFPEEITNNLLEEWISVLEEFPSRLEKLVDNLTNEQLAYTYRPNGWTIRQVIHHIADSHHNSYTRFKWSLTEDKPVIKAYFEDRWAKLPDYDFDIDQSLLHIKIIHHKLVSLLKCLNEADFNRSFIHPDGNETVSLKENVGIYAWHSNHHFVHIKNALKFENKF